MKTLYKILPVLALVLAFASCEENDATRDYGFPKIYIPQATVTGLDNSYPIPLGPLDQYTSYACKFDNTSGILDIEVGVIRSGYLAQQKGYSVDLGVSSTQTANKLAAYSEAGTPAAELPAAVVTVPSKITVPAGQSGEAVYVSVDLKALALQKTSLWVTDKYKLLVLGLEISNPTEYELADNNTSVVIVLDLNSEYWGTEVRTLFPMN